jgi:5'-methylthioinosine phosphorylase
MNRIDTAIIGGTGLYRMSELADMDARNIETPYGSPSSAIMVGTLEGRRVAFLTRHGDPHTHAPHRVNYRANIDALRRLGSRRIVAVNAVGGIADWAGPGVLAATDQLIDYTHGRLSSFSDFEGHKVEHIDLTNPYTPALRKELLAAAVRAGEAIHDGGVLGVTQGPRLETRAEVARLHRDGCDLVGMTSMPEAALAREAGIDYAGLAVVANWGAGRGPDSDAVIGMEEIERTLAEAMQRAQRVLRAFLGAG